MLMLLMVVCSIFLLYIIDRNGSRHMGAIHSSKQFIRL
ncbi:hypothetical protein V6Z11_D07G218000 [Gossypium hirsutum]